MRASDLGSARGTGYELVKSLATIVADVFVNGHKSPKDNQVKSTPANTQYIIAELVDSSSR